MDSVPITQVQDMPRLGYTKEEATKLVPCSLSHLNRAMEAGHLRFVRHGKKVIIPHDYLNEFVHMDFGHQGDDGVDPSKMIDGVS